MVVWVCVALSGTYYMFLVQQNPIQLLQDHWDELAQGIDVFNSSISICKACLWLLSHSQFWIFLIKVYKGFAIIENPRVSFEVPFQYWG